MNDETKPLVSIAEPLYPRHARWAGYAAPELKAPADVGGPDEVDLLQARVRELEAERDALQAKFDEALRWIRVAGEELGVRK